MFLGHFAAGFGLKRAAPRLSLGTLFAAVQMQDLLWPLLLLLGLENVRIDPGNTPFTPLDFHDYPLTHSMAGALLIAALFGGGYGAIRKDWRSAGIVSIAAFSHWLLDFATHRPDLLLWFTGGTKVGLGLWYSVGWTVAVESGMFAAGLLLYARGTRPRSPRGTVLLWTIVLLLVAIYALNILGPPPPDEVAIAVAGNATWLFVVLAWWADRNREPRPGQGAAR
jgi:hypothetical protein